MYNCKCVILVNDKVFIRGKIPNEAAWFDDGVANDISKKYF